MKRHVECSDCHAPHRTRATGTVQSGMPAALFGAAGVDVSGNVVQPAGFEYEVCFRCHGIDEQQTPIVLRADPPANARREFDVQNTSYHPVVAPGKSAQVPGLIGGQAETGTIRCIDCHSSDSAAGSAGARGPHGSVYRPILEREYAMADPGLESTDSYALCYKCHSREILLGARSRFPHREHVVGANAACAVCHDAHGSRRLPHLVNFMLQDELGNPVVRPAANGRLEYESLGIGRASCSLSCHGVDHAPKAYAR